MSLTIGTSPFGENRGGSFNFDTDVLKAHTLYLEGSPKRVRVELGGEVVADSRRVRLLHETGHLPVYYFPEEDVRTEVMEPSDHATHCPFKGDAGYRSVEAGGRMAENAVWTYPEPLDDCPLPPGLFAFEWDAMDAWYEEDEEVFVHPRDPYHRIDVLPSSRHVRVKVAGDVIAETRRPKLLLEAGLPVRYYLPPEDVRQDRLRESGKRTRCPYKGEARYRHVETGAGTKKNLAWLYPEPLHDAVGVGGHLCFFNEKVDIEVDGVDEPRPETRWS